MEPLLPPTDLYNISRADLYNELKSDPYKYFDKWELENNIDDFIKSYMYINEDNYYVIRRFVRWSIEYNKLDFLLFIFREAPVAFTIVEGLIKDTENATFVDNFLSLLNENDMKKLVTTTPLDYLIRLPRKDDNCNRNLIDLYFKYLDKSDFDVEKLVDSLELAKDLNCKDLFDDILTNIINLKEEGYRVQELEPIIKYYSNKAKI